MLKAEPVRCWSDRQWQIARTVGREEDGGVNVTALQGQVALMIEEIIVLRMENGGLRRREERVGGGLREEMWIGLSQRGV